MSNRRWIIVHHDRHGCCSMAESCQGRYTYATADEARKRLTDIMRNNSEEQIASVFGKQAIGTFGVRGVNCWPGHNDPVACVFEVVGDGKVKS